MAEHGSAGRPSARGTRSRRSLTQLDVEAGVYRCAAGLGGGRSPHASLLATVDLISVYLYFVRTGPIDWTDVAVEVTLNRVIAISTLNCNISIAFIASGTNELG